MFSFFDSRAAKEFGSEMARFYMLQMPLNMILKDKQFTTKSQKIIEKMSVRIINYKQKNKLNTYKVAQMGNAFKWTLKDAGYADNYVNELTQWFMVRVKT